MNSVYKTPSRHTPHKSLQKDNFFTRILTSNCASSKTAIHNLLFSKDLTSSRNDSIILENLKEFFSEFNEQYNFEPEANTIPTDTKLIHYLLSAFQPSLSLEETSQAYRMQAFVYNQLNDFLFQEITNLGSIKDIKSLSLISNKINFSLSFHRLQLGLYKHYHGLPKSISIEHHIQAIFENLDGQLIDGSEQVILCLANSSNHGEKLEFHIFHIIIKYIEFGSTYLIQVNIIDSNDPTNQKIKNSALKNQINTKYTLPFQTKSIRKNYLRNLVQKYQYIKDSNIREPNKIDDYCPVNSLQKKLAQDGIPDTLMQPIYRSQQKGNDCVTSSQLTLLKYFLTDANQVSLYKKFKKFMFGNIITAAKNHADLFELDRSTLEKRYQSAKKLINPG